MIWSFPGQTCDKDTECGLPNSFKCTSQKCSCNTADGYEDSNGLDDGGKCTKSLGRLYQFIQNKIFLQTLVCT